MGIVKLIQYFDIKKVIRFKKCHAKIYVDSLFFWELWQMLRSLEYFEDQEIERDYLVHIFTNILALELRAESIETLEAIYIVFDNNSSRNYMKWPRCMVREQSRTHRNLGNVRTKRLNIDSLRSTVANELWLDNLQLSDDIKTQIRGKIHIVEAPLDADDNIVTAGLQAMQAKHLHPSSLLLESGEHSAASSSVAIYSGDTDFMSMFPHSNRVSVLSYVHTVGSDSSADMLDANPSSNIYLRNFELAREAPLIKFLDEIIAREFRNPPNKEDYPWLTTEFMERMYMRCIALASPNDYLTCTLLDRQSLAKTIHQMFVWCRFYSTENESDNDNTKEKTATSTTENDNTEPQTKRSKTERKLRTPLSQNQFCYTLAFTFLYNIIERDPKYLETNGDESRRPRNRNQMRATYITNALRTLLLIPPCKREDDILAAQRVSPYQFLTTDLAASTAADPKIQILSSIKEMYDDVKARYEYVLLTSDIKEQNEREFKKVISKRWYADNCPSTLIPVLKTWLALRHEYDCFGSFQVAYKNAESRQAKLDELQIFLKCASCFTHIFGSFLLGLMLVWFHWECQEPDAMSHTVCEFAFRKFTHTLMAHILPVPWSEQDNDDFFCVKEIVCTFINLANDNGERQPKTANNKRKRVTEDEESKADVRKFPLDRPLERSLYEQNFALLFAKFLKTYEKIN